MKIFSMYENLHKAFNKSCIQPIESSNGKSFFEIKETAPNSKFKALKIFGINDRKSLLIKFDHFHCLKSSVECSIKSNFLDHKCKYINKSCDYILYTEHKGRDFIFFIECKSSSHDKKDVRRQLKNADYFTQYLHNLLKFHFNTETPKFEKVNILFYTSKSICKTSIKSSFTKISHKELDIITKHNYSKSSQKVLNLHINTILKGWTN